MQSIPDALTALGVSLRTPHREIDGALKQVGVLHYDSDYAKDHHFTHHIIPLTIKSMEDVHRFLGELDGDSPPSRDAGCTKAYVARHWLNTTPKSITDLDWAIIGLARARRTCCGCHENLSFTTRNN